MEGGLIELANLKVPKDLELRIIVSGDGQEPIRFHLQTPIHKFFSTHVAVKSLKDREELIKHKRLTLQDLVDMLAKEINVLHP